VICAILVAASAGVSSPASAATRPSAVHRAGSASRTVKPATRRTSRRPAAGASKSSKSSKSRHYRLPKPKPKPKAGAKGTAEPVVGIPKDPNAPLIPKDPGGPVTVPATSPPPAGPSSTSADVSTSPAEVVGELSDAQAARLVAPVAENRTDNATDNQTVPTAAELAALRSEDKSMPASYLARIDGDYRGTTDEIIQWAAYKWGLDPQLLRAVAAVESWWHMSTVGDGGNAFGLFQLDVRYHCCETLAQTSTAFDADYYAAIVRSYYDGAQTWLNTVSGNGRPYAAGDLWDSVGYWAAGRWDTPTGASYDAQVQSDLSQEVWLGQWF
jgi:hypothetical protein